MDIEGASPTIYALKLARTFWSDEELSRHLVVDVGGPNRRGQTTRIPFEGINLTYIKKIKGKFMF